MNKLITIAVAINYFMKIKYEEMQSGSRNYNREF